MSPNCLQSDVPLCCVVASNQTPFIFKLPSMTEYGEGKKNQKPISLPRVLFFSQSDDTLQQAHQGRGVGHADASRARDAGL